jgi:hypothetical protein
MVSGKRTRAYQCLKKAFDAGLPPPKLTTTISAKFDDCPKDDQWGTREIPLTTRLSTLKELLDIAPDDSRDLSSATPRLSEKI